jgi:hypothetical protein
MAWYLQAEKLNVLWKALHAPVLTLAYLHRHTHATPGYSQRQLQSTITETCYSAFWASCAVAFPQRRGLQH